MLSRIVWVFILLILRMFVVFFSVFLFDFFGFVAGVSTTTESSFSLGDFLLKLSFIIVLCFVLNDFFLLEDEEDDFVCLSGSVGNLVLFVGMLLMFRFVFCSRAICAFSNVCIFWNMFLNEGLSEGLFCYVCCINVWYDLVLRKVVLCVVFIFGWLLFGTMETIW